MKKKGGDGQNTQYTKIIYDEDKKEANRMLQTNENNRRRTVTSSIGQGPLAKLRSSPG